MELFAVQSLRQQAITASESLERQYSAYEIADFQPKTFYEQWMENDHIEYPFALEETFNALSLSTRPQRSDQMFTLQHYQFTATNLCDF